MLKTLRLFCLCLGLACALGASSSAGAAAPEDASTWLVTYGPGEIYWQRFGHNAIWIRDPALGLDHVFNFGFFDFAQQDFFLRFLQGRMLYFSAAQPAREEFAQYIDENRSIRAQRLALAPAQQQALTRYLLSEIQPENRDYLYDYYVNNCSTRVRDALDRALGGALSESFEAVPAAQGWRDHTRRLTVPDFWLYLGLEIVLGAPVDRPVSRWDEMFIPEILAESVQGLAGHDGAPLVLEDVVLYRSTLDAPPAHPQAWWPRYLLASVLLLMGAALASKWLGPGFGRGLARGWLIVAGLAGLALCFFWIGTDHSVARTNLNVLVLNPLWLWVALLPPGRRWALPTVAALSLISLVLPFVPPQQYNLDVLAALLPLNLAAAWAIGRPGR